jgi:ionotropic kainate glutamate receptor 2
MTREGVAAIFGPQSRSTAGMVQSVCDNKEIPHLETRWEPRSPPAGSCHINLYPHPKVLALVSNSI